MNRSSTLKVSVNTTDAAGKLRTFTTALLNAEKQGISLNEALSNLGKTNNFGGFNKSAGAAKAHMKDMATSAKEARTAMEGYAAAVAKAGGSNSKITATAAQAKIEQQKLAAATTKAGAAAVKAANDASIGQQKLAAASSQATNASTKAGAAAAKAANDAAIGQQRLITTTSQATISTVRIGAEIVKTANASAMAQQRLAAATSQAAAASTRAGAATVKATNDAAIGQQRLITTTSQATISTIRIGAAVVKTANDAAMAQQKLETATIKTGAAGVKAANDAAIGQQRLAAATSQTAAVATRADAAAVKATNDAAIGQQRLQDATIKTGAAGVKAANDAAMGQQRLAATTSRTTAAATAAANAAVIGQQRIAGATAAAAAQQDRAALAALRLASAQARAAADLARLGNAGATANVQLNGLVQTLNRMQGFLQGGFMAVTGISFLKTADEMAALNNQIRLVTKSEEEFIGVREHMRRVADKNFADIANTTNLYQKSARALADMGKSQKDAIVFTDGVSLAMRTGGRSALEQASAIYQLSQSMGAGILNGDEFRTITETSPLLLSLVAKEMGVLQGDLKNLSKEGEITSEILYNAITGNIEMLEAMAAKMPVTMGQALQVFKSQYKNFTNDIMNDTGGMSASIAKAIQLTSMNFETMAKVSIAVVTLGMLQLAASIDVAALSMRAFNLITAANPILLAITAVLMLGSAFYGLDDVLGVTSTLFGDLIGKITEGYRLMGDLATQSEDTAERMTNANGTFHVDYRRQYDESGRRSINFFHNLEDGFTGAVQAAARTTAGITVSFTAMYQFLARGIDDVGKTIANGFIWIFNQVKIGINNLSSEMVEWVRKDIALINTIAGAANKALDFVGSKRRVPMMGAAGGRGTNLQPTAYLDNTFVPYSTHFARQYDMVVDPLDNYFRQVGREQRYKNQAKVPYVLDEQPMDYDKKYEYDRRKLEREAEDLEKERKKAEKAQKTAKAAKEKIEPMRVNELVLEQARLYDYAGLEKKYKLQQGTLAAVSMQESKGKADARNPISGATGAFQFMPPAAKRFGLKDRTNVEDSALAAAKYLSWLENRFGSLELALAGYNWGEGNVDQFVAGKKKMPRETREYIKEVPQYLAYMQGGMDGSVNIGGNIESFNEEKRREAEEIIKKQNALIKEYASPLEKIKIEYGERLDAILEAKFDDKKSEELAVDAYRIMKRQEAEYENSLNNKIGSLADFQRTKSEMLARERDNEQFNLKLDPDLSRPENAQKLQDGLDLIQQKYQYDLDMHNDQLNRQERDMYSFRRTERQALLDGWADKIRDASFMTDELADMRMDALQKQKDYELSLFDAGHDHRMLELRKQHMSEIAYIQEKYRLDAYLNSITTEDDEVKKLQAVNLKVNAAKETEDAQKRVGGDYGKQTRRLRGQGEEETNVKDAWTVDHEVAAKAFEEGIIGLQEYHERMLELDQDFVNKKQAILASGHEANYGLATAAMSALGLENSKAYKLMLMAQKGHALHAAWLNSKVAILDAYANTAGNVWAKAAAAAKVAATTGVMTAAIAAVDIKGFKKGGYTGNVGVNDVAGQVHGQEYVFDAAATRRIGTSQLDRIRKGEETSNKTEAAPVININIIIEGNKATTTGDLDNKHARQLASSLEAAVRAVLIKEKRQGGLIYGT